MKAPASVSQTKSKQDAPIGDFVVSDDDFDLSSSSSESECVSDDDNDCYIEHHDSASPLQMISSARDKENRPIINVPEDSDKVSQKPKRAVNANSDTNLAGLNMFLIADIVELLLCFAFCC